MLKDRAILMLAIGQTLVWAGAFYLFPAMLVRWEADLGWSKSDLTLAITLAVLTSAIAAPFAGRAIDRGHGPMQMGLTTLLAGCAVMALSQVVALWQFYALWGVIGLCLAGCLYEPCFAMVTRARGADAKQGIIWITLLAGLAGTVSFPAVHVLSEAFGWRVAVLMIGGFVALVVAPLLWAGAQSLGQTAAARPKPAPVSYQYLRLPAYWLLGLGFALAAITHGAALHHFLPLLAERGVESGAAVFAAACIGPMQVLGRLGMVATQHRLSSHIFALIAFGFMGLSVLFLMVAGASLILLGGFVLFFGCAYGTVSILRPVIARDILGEADFGSKSGGLAMMYLAASASSAFVGALLWGVGGYQLMLAVLICCSTVGVCLYAAAQRIARRDS